MWIRIHNNTVLKGQALETTGMEGPTFLLTINILIVVMQSRAFLSGARTELFGRL